MPTRVVSFLALLLEICRKLPRLSLPITAGLQIIPFWLFQYFPSQDGPSHLYNTNILNSYSTTPIFREYYYIHLSAAGNILSQLLLSGLAGLFGYATAEKLFLTLYAVLMIVGFSSLLTTLKCSATPFVLFVFLFTPNYFLFMGFWNFCLSIPICLIAMSYYWKSSARPTFRSYLIIATLSLLTYAAHMLSWAVLLVIISTDALPFAIGIWRSAGARDRLTSIRPRAALAVCAAIPAVLIFFYLTQINAGAQDALEETFRGRAWPLYSTSFLRGLSAAGPATSAFFIGTVIFLFVIAALNRCRHPRLLPTDTLLVSSLSIAILSIAASNGFGGAYVRERFSLYAWMLLVIWLAIQQWSQTIQRVAHILLVTACIGFAITGLSSIRTWNRELTEYVTASQVIESGSTILPIQLDRRSPNIDPMLHAVDLVAIQKAVDLRNYEAILPYFTVAYKPGRSPHGFLSFTEEPAGATIPFDIPGFERAARGHVDYVLAYGSSRAGAFPETHLYSQQLAGFEHIWTSEPAHLVRVYRSNSDHVKPLRGSGESASTAP